MIKKWTFEKCKEIAQQYNNRVDFKKYNYAAFVAAGKYHWMRDICSHMTK